MSNHDPYSDSPEPVGWIQHHQLYSSGGADIVMESITLKTPQWALWGYFASRCQKSRPSSLKGGPSVSCCMRIGAWLSGNQPFRAIAAKRLSISSDSWFQSTGR
jgi:hypothetical protein